MYVKINQVIYLRFLYFTTDKLTIKKIIEREKEEGGNGGRVDM